jgi:radical SAM protein with 4Fe4S-binding SPASM domain
VESCSYGEFSKAVHRPFAGRRLPLDGTIETTHRCNLKCAHCYNSLPIEDSGARRRELTYHEHCRILDEAADAGCLWLLFTGGEIFARPDFLDIYIYAKQKGFLITLFTNATLITPQAADHLARYRPFSIEITLYGRTRKTYERITGVPGSFEKCLRGIRLLKERNLPLAIKTVAATVNKHEIWDLKEFVEQDLGLEFRFDAMINPRIDRSQRPLSYRLTPEEVVALDLLDPARIDAWKSLARRFNGPVHAPEAGDEMYHCGGGIHSFSINPQGQMTLCPLSQFDGYDLRRGSFMDAWERHLFNVRRRKTTRTTKCVSCEIKAMCGMCPANGELEEKDPESPVDFLCRVAHLRCYALDIPVPAHGECEYCKGGSAYRDMKNQAAHLRNKILNPGSIPEEFNTARRAAL